MLIRKAQKPKQSRVRKIMGTQAIMQVRVDGNPLMTVFVSMDGYLDGFGKSILPILKRKHVNGYRDAQKEYNRVGNFCALVVAKLVNEHHESAKRVAEFCKKEQPKELACGGIELINDPDRYNPDYFYYVDFENNMQNPQPPMITVSSCGKTVSNLTVAQFEDLIATGFDDEEEE